MSIALGCRAARYGDKEIAVRFRGNSHYRKERMQSILTKSECLSVCARRYPLGSLKGRLAGVLRPICLYARKSGLFSFEGRSVIIPIR